MVVSEGGIVRRTCRPAVLAIAALVFLAGSWVSPSRASGDEGCVPQPDGEAIVTEDLSLKGFSGPITPPALGLAPAANQDDFDVTHYKLALAFAPSTQIVSGTVTITGTSLVPGLGSIDLDFYNNMAISGITSGATSVTWSRASNVLTVNLDRLYNASESFQVAVTYSGSPTNVDSSFSWPVRPPPPASGFKVIQSLSEPFGARTWWPCKDRPDDKATAEMIFTVPQNYVATSNGVLTGVTTDTGAGTKTYTWVTNAPITTYLVSIAGYPYSTFSHTYTPIAGGSMPVDYYVYPSHFANAQVIATPRRRR